MNVIIVFRINIYSFSALLFFLKYIILEKVSIISDLDIIEKLFLSIYLYYIGKKPVIINSIKSFKKKEESEKKEKKLFFLSDPPSR